MLEQDANSRRRSRANLCRFQKLGQAIERKKCHETSQDFGKQARDGNDPIVSNCERKYFARSSFSETDFEHSTAPAKNYGGEGSEAISN